MLLKKIVKILLGILAFLLAAVLIVFAYLFLFQRSLLRSIYSGLTETSESIEEKKQTNDKELLNTIKGFGFDLNDSDLQRLNDGSMTEEEMKNLLLDKTNNTTPSADSEEPQDSGGSNTQQAPDIPETPDKQPPAVVTPSVTWNENKVTKPPAQQSPTMDEAIQSPSSGLSQQGSSQQGTDKTGTETPAAQNPYNEKIASLVARMYVLKSQFSGKIDGIVSSMKAEYNALPERQQNVSARSEIATRYMGQISSLEAQCDAQVNSVITELRTALTESGQSMTLADSVLSAYQNEKEITKAYYVNRYSK